MRISRAFIGFGLICVVLGMAFGMWMGIRGDFTFVAAHAHLNLAGFVTSSLYGLIHRTHPAMAKSRLAWPQFAIHVVGILLFIPGIALVVAARSEILVIPGGILVLLAAVTFLYMFLSAKTEPA